MLCVVQCPPEVEFSELLFPSDVAIKKYSLPGANVVGELAGNRNTKVSNLTCVGESHKISAG